MKRCVLGWNSGPHTCKVSNLPPKDMSLALPSTYMPLFLTYSAYTQAQHQGKYEWKEHVVHRHCELPSSDALHRPAWWGEPHSGLCGQRTPHKATLIAPRSAGHLLLFLAFLDNLLLSRDALKIAQSNFQSLIVIKRGVRNDHIRAGSKHSKSSSCLISIPTSHPRSGDFPVSPFGKALGPLTFWRDICECLLFFYRKTKGNAPVYPGIGSLGSLQVGCNLMSPMLSEAPKPHITTQKPHINREEQTKLSACRAGCGPTRRWFSTEKKTSHPFSVINWRSILPLISRCLHSAAFASLLKITTAFSCKNFPHFSGMQHCSMWPICFWWTKTKLQMIRCVHKEVTLTANHVCDTIHLANRVWQCTSFVRIHSKWLLRLFKSQNPIFNASTSAPDFWRGARDCHEIPKDT